MDVKTLEYLSTELLGKDHIQCMKKVFQTSIA